MNNELKVAVDKVFSDAKNAGVKCEVIGVESESSSTSFENKKMDEFSTGKSLSLGVRFVKGQKECFFSTESTKPEDLERLTKQQLEAIDYSKENPNLTLAKANNDSLDELDIYSTESPSQEEKIERIKSLDDAVWSCDERVKNVRGTGISESLHTLSFLDSDQNLMSYNKSSYGIWTQLLAQDGDSLASGSYSQTKYEYEDLMPNEFAIKTVKERALGLLNSTTPETGDYPVVIDRRAFSSILGLIIPMLKADNVDKGLSLFGDSMGQKISSGILQIEDNPSSLKGMGSRPFDGEGKASKKTLLVGDGVINAFLSNQEYSEKMNIPNTHNASRAGNGRVGISPSNILMRSGTLATTAIKAMKPKLIEIQNIMGLHAGFNDASGDFSFQAEGYMYEMGVKTAALQNFVVSGNIKDLLMKIEDVGAGLLDNGSSIVCPDVLIRSLKIVS